MPSNELMRIIKEELVVILVSNFRSILNALASNNVQQVRLLSRNSDVINQYINRDMALNLINDAINKVNNDPDINEHVQFVNAGEEDNFISANEINEVVEGAKHMNSTMNHREDQLRQQLSTFNNQNGGKSKKRRRKKRKTKRRILKRKKTKRKKSKKKGGQILAQSSQSMIEALTHLQDAYVYSV